MYRHNGLRIKGPITINDNIYPINYWDHLSPNELLSLGVEYVPDHVMPDPALYTWTERPDGTLDIKPLSVPPPMWTEKQLIDARINAIETTITSRRLREALLSKAGADWLLSQDNAIKALRLLK